jgi:hypothetical protein
MILDLSHISDVVWYAIIIAISSTASPLTLSYLTNRHNRADRLEDWARQDAVAAKAATTASLLVENNKKVAQSTAITNTKLDVIHTLVNSNMTAALQSELGAVKRELVLIREVMKLNRADGHEISVETLATEQTAVVKVAELSAALLDRLSNT